MKKQIISSTIIFVLLTMSHYAFAVQGVLTARVATTLVAADGRFGGCMARLTRNVNNASNSPNCPAQGWVTFSCDGTFTSQDVAYRMLDQAQLAKAIGRPVTVFVDDARKHNGFCFATRIDLL